MDLKQLKYFIQVATFGGFNRAAIEANVAQSALSRQVRRLEDELGVELFIRASGGVRITPEGEAFLQRAQGLLRHLQQIREETLANSKTPRGDLAIGLPSSLQPFIGGELLGRIRREAPQVFVRVKVGTSVALKELVQTGVVDLALVGAIDPDPTLNINALYRDELYLIGGPDSALTPDTVVDIATLPKYPLILTSRPNSLRVVADNAALSRNTLMNVVMEVDHIGLIIEMVRRGAGYTLFPYRAVRSEVQAGRLKASHVVPHLSFNWTLISSASKPLSATGRYAHRAMQEIASTHLPEPPPSDRPAGATPAASQKSVVNSSSGEVARATAARSRQ
jgi:LysR family nitrogen assimilation transcriptional regulator